MPNWVSNSIQSPNINALLRLRDFNRIVPQPLVTENISGSLPDHALRLFQQGKSWRDLLEDPVFLDCFDADQRCPSPAPPLHHCTDGAPLLAGLPPARTSRPF